MNNIEKAFSQITASESLKRRTADFVISRTQAQRKTQRVRLWCATAAVFILILGGFGFHTLNTTPVSYISIDVNPSIELTLNRFQRVLSATPYNQDGEAVLDDLNLEGKIYTDAIEELLAGQAFSSYATSDAALTFTVVSDQEGSLISGIQDCVDKTSFSAACKTSDPEAMARAHDNQLSFGKYRAFLELQQYDASVTPDQVRSMTMRQIYDLISQYSGAQVSPPGNGAGAGNQGSACSSQEDKNCQSRDSSGGNGGGQGPHGNNNKTSGSWGSGNGQGPLRNGTAGHTGKNSG